MSKNQQYKNPSYVTGACNANMLTNDIKVSTLMQDDVRVPTKLQNGYDTINFLNL